MVEDRNFDPRLAQSDDTEESDASDESEPVNTDSALCKKYCDEALAVCTGEYELFKTKGSCLSVCALLDEGPADLKEAPNTNTVACRYVALQGAKLEVDECQGAAVASQICGTPCQTYCKIQPDVCGDVPTEIKLEQDDCEHQCEGVPMTPSFSMVDNYTDDSIQCRLIHLVTAAAGTEFTTQHCPHARLASPLKCGEGNDINCQNYCQTVTAACTGDLTQFTSQEACEQTCLALPPGKMGESTGNTLACRHYHAYSALSDPEKHCSHAGPITDGHCGGPDTENCESYCVLAEKACATEFTDKYESPADCIETCTPLPGSTYDSKYPPLQSDAGDTQVVQRFIQAATKVLGQEPGATCDDVFEADSLLGL